MQKQHSQLCQSSWNWLSVLWPGSSWLFQVQLIFSSGVSLFPFLWGQFSEFEAAYVMATIWSWLTSSMWWKFQYLQDSSQDMAQNIIYSPWEETRSAVAQSCLTLCDLMDCNLPGSSVHGISQAKILGWVVISFSRGSSQRRDWTCVLCRWFFTTGAA